MEGIFVGFKNEIISNLYEVYLPSKNKTVSGGDVIMTEHVDRPNPERLLPLLHDVIKEYTINDFKYLKDTYHYDYHESVTYKVIKVYEFKGDY